MLEPKPGRVALILAFGYTVVASLLWYRVQQVPTLLIPVVLSALPLMATTRRQGVALRLVAGVLLVLWVGLGALSVGPWYLPAVVTIFIAHVLARKSNAGDTDAG
jgi:hypothetical protein